MGVSLTPEEMNALVQSGVLDARQPQLEAQLAKAAALRGQKMADRSTPTGSILSGIGGLITNASGALQENDLQQQLAELAQQRGAAELPGKRLQALMAKQKVASGDQDLALGKQRLDAGAADMAEKAAERERAGQPAAAPLQALFGGLAPELRNAPVTNRDVSAAGSLSQALASLRDRRADRAESRAKREAAMKAAGTKQMADTEESLRKEYTGNKLVKDTIEVATAYEKVKQAAANPSAAGDIALVYGLMKMLDPGSTVREGEYATAANAGSVPDRMVSAYNRALSGEMLAPNIRQDFLSSAGKAYQGQLATFRKFRDTYKGLATGSGVNPDRVALPLGLDEGAAPSAGPAPTHYLISPDGKMRVPADAQGKPLGPAEPNPGG